MVKAKSRPTCDSIMPAGRTVAGNQLLCRAVVSLPDHMCEFGNLFQERIVFFEAPYASANKGRYLEKLLAVCWHVNTDGWVENGVIYNLCSAYELFDNAQGAENSGDLRLFETGFGGELGIGPDHTHYARQANIDLLVTPRIASRLQNLSDQIESLYTRQRAQGVAA